MGGESGKDARPFDLAWGRSVIAQGREAGVAVFVKQLGAYPFVDVHPYEESTGKGGDPDEWPADLRVREVPHVA